MAEAVEITLNGERVTLEVEDDELLLDSLRLKLGELGVRYACGIGVCGACAVLLDGAPVSSCLLFTTMVAGRRVQTPEHYLGSAAGARSLQAFVEADAFQCSYCIPAMAMTAAWCLETRAGITAEELREVLAGHLCRCGSYPQVLAAIERLVAWRDDGSDRAARRAGARR